MSTSTLTYNSRLRYELTRREVLNAALEEFATKVFWATELTSLYLKQTVQG